MQLSAFHPRIGKIEYIGSPINFSTFETQNNMPPPLLGEHNVEILSNLGYSDNDINQFIDNGIILLVLDNYNYFSVPFTIRMNNYLFVRAATGRCSRCTPISIR